MARRVLALLSTGPVLGLRAVFTYVEQSRPGLPSPLWLGPRSVVGLTHGFRSVLGTGRVVRSRSPSFHRRLSPFHVLRRLGAPPALRSPEGRLRGGWGSVHHSPTLPCLSSGVGCRLVSSSYRVSGHLVVSVGLLTGRVCVGHHPLSWVGRISKLVRLICCHLC